MGVRNLAGPLRSGRFRACLDWDRSSSAERCLCSILNQKVEKSLVCAAKPKLVSCECQEDSSAVVKQRTEAARCLGTGLS